MCGLGFDSFKGFQGVWAWGSEGENLKPKPKVYGMWGILLGLYREKWKRKWKLL